MCKKIEFYLVALFIGFSLLSGCDFYNEVNFKICNLFLVTDWLSLIPPTGILAGIGYMSYLAFCPHGRPVPSQRCNNKIRLNEEKVVDFVDIEDISEKAAFCRCWKSKNVSALDGLI